MTEAKGNMKKLYEATIRMLKTEQKALQDPKAPQHAMYVSGLTGSIGGLDPEQYKQAVNELVKKRLKESLELTQDIDFNAKLIQIARAYASQWLKELE